MKRNYMSIIFIVFIVGILIGILAKDYNRQGTTYLNKDKLIKKEIKSTNKSIKVMRKEKKELEKEIESLKSKKQDTKMTNQLDTLKESLGYIDVTGSGLQIKIDSMSDETGNIANFVDYNKILLNIVNDLKLNGAEFIAINNQRMNQYSEISLAGNHININSTPIAPPYNISVIGDIEKLTNYMNKENTYIDSLGNNYQLKVEYKIEENMTIEKMSIINKLEYMEDE